MMKNPVKTCSVCKTTKQLDCFYSRVEHILGRMLLWHTSGVILVSIPLPFLNFDANIRPPSSYQFNQLRAALLSEVL